MGRQQQLPLPPPPLKLSPRGGYANSTANRVNVLFRGEEGGHTFNASNRPTDVRSRALLGGPRTVREQFGTCPNSARRGAIIVRALAGRKTARTGAAGRGIPWPRPVRPIDLTMIAAGPYRTACSLPSFSSPIIGWAGPAGTCVKRCGVLFRRSPGRTSGQVVRRR